MLVLTHTELSFESCLAFTGGRPTGIRNIQIVRPLYVLSLLTLTLNKLENGRGSPSNWRTRSCGMFYEGK